MKWKLVAGTGVTLAVLGGAQLYFGGDSVSIDSQRQEGLFLFGGQRDFGVVVADNGTLSINLADKNYALVPSEVKYDTGSDKHSKSIFINSEKVDGTKAKIDGVFGSGSRVEVIVTGNSVRKITSLDEGFLASIPVGAEYVEVSFNLSGDWNVANGMYNSRQEIQKDVWLEKALAWDSSPGDPNQNYVDVEFEINNGVLIKKIPVSWLETAQFPIYTDAVFTFGTKELFDTGVVGTIDTVKIGTDKSAICWQDNADAAAEGQCIVASVSGTDLTFGAVSDFSADIVGANNAAQGACAAGTDRWVVVFADDADADDGTARVASSTGTTINGYGTALDFDDGVATRDPVCTYVATDKVVIAWGDTTNTMGEAVACTIGTDYTLTCGTKVTLLDIANNVLDFSCDTLDTDKFICHYRDGGVNQGSYVHAGSVSGTTITLGSAATISAAHDGTIVYDTLGHSLTSPTTDKFAVHWGSSTGTQLRLALGSVSGTTITLGATTTSIIATSTSFASLNTINASNGFLYYQQGATDAGTTFLAAIPIDFNFNSLTFSTSTAERVDTTTDPGSLHAVKIGDTKFLFAWEDDNDTNDLFAIVADIIEAGPVQTLFKNVQFYLKNGQLYKRN